MRKGFNSGLIIVGISLMVFLSLFDSVLPPWTMYVDDVFCAIVAILLIINVIAGKQILRFYILIPLLFIVGLFGNLIYDIQPNLFLALTDGFMFFKPYILLIYIAITISVVDANVVYGVITKLSKFTIIVLFLFMILSILFKDTLKSQLFLNNYFVFYSGFTGTVAMTVIFCMAVIVSNANNNRLLYYMLCVAIIIGTGSGLGMLSVVLYGAIYYFFDRKRSFHWYYFLIIVPLCVCVGWNEISGYLLDTNAPRYLLFYYSLVTAWDYIPIGSGFASFGSPLAATQYSSLYYRYGFNYKWGMSEGDTSFLLDSYFPQIIAQTGILGSAIYVTFIYKVFSYFIFSIKDVSVKSSAIFIFIIWLASGLGFGCGSTWGYLVWMIIPIFYLINENYEGQDANSKNN